MARVDVCPECKGIGKVWVKLGELSDEDPADPMICPECDGTGVPYED